MFLFSKYACTCLDIFSPAEQKCMWFNLFIYRVNNDEIKKWSVLYIIVIRTFSNLKTLSKNQHEKLLTAKAVRENETAEENQHLPQCNTIPGSDSLNGNIHGVHLEPCYKKFTSILAPSRKRTLREENYDKFERLKRQKCSQSNSGLFPKRCFKCNTFRKRKGGKTFNAYTITTKNAAEKLNEAIMKELCSLMPGTIQKITQHILLKKS